MSLIQRTAPDVAERAAVGRAAQGRATQRPRRLDAGPTALTRSRCCAPRTTTACRTSCRSAGAACRSRRSPSTAARPRSWPPIWRRCRAPASRCSSAATRTSRTSASSARRSARCSSTSTTSTRRCPGRSSGTSSASRRASSSPPATTASARTVARDTALAAARSYREHMAAYAEMRELDVWYSRVVADDLLEMAVARRAPQAGSDKGVEARPQGGREGASPRRVAATACRRPPS